MMKMAGKSRQRDRIVKRANTINWQYEFDRCWKHCWCRCWCKCGNCDDILAVARSQQFDKNVADAKKISWKDLEAWEAQETQKTWEAQETSPTNRELVWVVYSVFQIFQKGNLFWWAFSRQPYGLAPVGVSDTSNSTGCSCSMILRVWSEEKFHCLLFCFKGRSIVTTERLWLSPHDHSQLVSLGSKSSGCIQAELIARDAHLLAASLPLVGHQANHVGSVLRRSVRVESVAFSLVHHHSITGPSLGTAGSNTWDISLKNSQMPNWWSLYCHLDLCIIPRRATS